MTATFGKLNHETLTLKPGLNVIQAPNEWGKSTWCAFLVNMLYGIDTRARSGGTQLVDKEHYAPWSGAPMSGRIELSWEGRDITIERSSKGRIPFGEFKAYETHTGIEVPELNGANCGQKLLGVERPVFSRAGFIRLQDMPVTQDDALRRRLNSLVTTGDENSAGDRLGQKLRELKNKCRSNRANGLIPQAEYERDDLKNQLDALRDHREQIEKLTQQQKDQEAQLQALENHLVALRYEANRAGGQRIAEAQATCQTLERELSKLEDECARLPSLQVAEQAQQAGQALLDRRKALEAETRLLPPVPQKPEVPQIYQGMEAEAAVEQAGQDFARRTTLVEKQKKKLGGLWVLLAVAAVAIGGALAVRFAMSIDHPLVYITAGAVILLAALITLIESFSRSKNLQKEIAQLDSRHPGLSPESWVDHAARYREADALYKDKLQTHQAISEKLSLRQQELAQELEDYVTQSTLEATLHSWSIVADKHLQVAAKGVQLRNAQQQLQALQEVAGNYPPPQFPDTLQYSESYTLSLLEATRTSYQQAQLQLGQRMGQAETFGDEAVIRARLDSVNRRIARLEDTYEALSLAQDALYQATTSLQRRFAPRISKRAQELFSRLTQGRYQKITLGDDLSMNASAQDEDTLRPAQWRSDGTVDQLYFALRLAVAAELTPNAPLVLDDALVRFDDDRLTQALQVLQEQAEEKQVLLFTCQSREGRIVG